MSNARNQNIFMDQPDSLYDLAMGVFVYDVETFAGYGNCVRSKREISLPIELWERFLSAYQKQFRVDDDMIRVMYENDCRLNVLRLRRAHITDCGLEMLMKTKPRELELIDCDRITPNCLQHINDNSDNLTTVTLINTEVLKQGMVLRRGEAIRAPALRRLTLKQRGLEIVSPPIIGNLNELTYLDLSECELIVGVTSSRFEKLETLILHGVPAIQTIIDWIVSLKSLKHLDVSQTIEHLGEFHLPNAVLLKLVTNLPLLTHLDISGTNLAGFGAQREEGGTPEAKCDIPGLASRTDRPLAFLGLYATQYMACKRHDIPALRIAGDKNEEQILTAAAAYMDRPEVLTKVLNDLYYLFRYDDNRQVLRSLALVLDAMERHIAVKTVQISGSATIFYIVKDKVMETIPARTRRRIITALLLAMEAHIKDETMMRNGCLGLTRFRIPADVLFQYERMATVLLIGVLDSRLEDFVRRMGIYLLNSLACQVDSQHKKFLGNCGAIGSMLDIISERLENATCDAMLEMAWSTLWNMTDEMPDNCERFLRLNGLQLFLACLESFPNNDDQLRNMMGLLGNVAENASLRTFLVTPTLLKVFYELLNSARDGIEVSYNAGGVLAHILSDGPAAWSARQPARAAVLERLAAAVERWDMRAERNINYRSFRPILSLLRAHHTPQCQHWAAWALANLTAVYPEKYCSLIKSEGGIRLLQSVIEHEAPYARVKELCRAVIANVDHAETAREPHQAALGNG